ncbi:MAG: hypothetical protein ACC628_06250 [Pirellulaceae bacterium]
MQIENDQRMMINKTTRPTQLERRENQGQNQSGTCGKCGVNTHANPDWQDGQFSFSFTVAAEAIQDISSILGLTEREVRKP